MMSLRMMPATASIVMPFDATWMTLFSTTARAVLSTTAIPPFLTTRFRTTAVPGKNRPGNPGDRLRSPASLGRFDAGPGASVVIRRARRIPLGAAGPRLPPPAVSHPVLCDDPLLVQPEDPVLGPDLLERLERLLELRDLVVGRHLGPDPGLPGGDDREEEPDDV